mmetsp:Transcript_17279/g.50228  ORF Transcript_17279/g.50228 Transcript_17279/m.50228 type:complete len:214 (-) Transcript_17279:219-860(-)
MRLGRDPESTSLLETLRPPPPSPSWPRLPRTSDGSADGPTDGPSTLSRGKSASVCACESRGVSARECLTPVAASVPVAAAAGGGTEPSQPAQHPPCTPGVGVPLLAPRSRLRVRELGCTPPEESHCGAPTPLRASRDTWTVRPGILDLVRETGVDAGGSASPTAPASASGSSPTGTICTRTVMDWDFRVEVRTVRPWSPSMSPGASPLRYAIA